MNLNSPLEQHEQEILAQAEQTDRASYTSRTNMSQKVSKLNTARETFWELEPNSSRTLPASPVRQERDALQNRNSHVEQQAMKTIGEGLNNESNDEVIEFWERKLHGRAQSIIELVSKRNDFFGQKPKVRKPHRLMTKRQLVIRKSTTEADLLVEKDPDTFEDDNNDDVNEKHEAPRYSVFVHDICEEGSKEAGASTSKKGTSLKKSLVNKHSQNSGSTKKSYSNNIPFVSNILTQLYSDDKAKYIRGRLESMASVRDSNELRISNKKMSLGHITDRNFTCKSIKSTKGVLLEPLALEKAIHSDVVSQIKEGSTTDLAISQEPTKQTINVKEFSKNKTQSCSPSSGKSRVIEPLIVSPRLPIALEMLEIGSRTGGKATTVKNLKEKSHQMKALHSVQRMTDLIKWYD